MAHCLADAGVAPTGGAAAPGEGAAARTGAGVVGRSDAAHAGAVSGVAGSDEAGIDAVEIAEIGSIEVESGAAAAEIAEAEKGLRKEVRHGMPGLDQETVAVASTNQLQALKPGLHHNQDTQTTRPKPKQLPPQHTLLPNQPQRTLLHKQPGRTRLLRQPTPILPRQLQHTLLIILMPRQCRRTPQRTPRKRPLPNPSTAG